MLCSESMYNSELHEQVASMAFFISTYKVRFQLNTRDKVYLFNTKCMISVAQLFNKQVGSHSDVGSQRLHQNLEAQKNTLSPLPKNVGIQRPINNIG